MDPYYCQPVWSFDRPSRHDGFIVWFALRTYWLVTVSGFQGSDCGGLSTYPAVLSAARRSNRVRRQGDTLRTRCCCVNRFLGSIFELRQSLVLRAVPGEEKRPPDSPGRRSNHDRRMSATDLAAMDSSPCGSQFSTLAPVPWTYPRCGGVMYQSGYAPRKGYSEVLCSYPVIGPFPHRALSYMPALCPYLPGALYQADRSAS